MLARGVAAEGADRIDRAQPPSLGSVCGSCRRPLGPKGWGLGRLGRGHSRTGPARSLAACEVTSGTVTHGSRLYAGHVGHERAAKLALDEASS